MTRDPEVKILMRKYVDGEITVSDLSDRVVPVFWGADAPAVVHDLDLLLAEVSGGHRSAGSLRSELAGLVGQSRVESSFFPVISASHSNAASHAAFEMNVPGSIQLPHQADAIGQGTPA